ncbi:MAG: RsmE family RNA methyltransferase [Patescibacteria group bacterium]|nr:RsmE family RNA methyltransferase [Patescibacteria group bacterium]
MRLNRFIIDSDLHPGVFELADPDATRQITQVLRLKTGEMLMLCDGQGREALAKISAFGKNRVTLELGKPQAVDREPKRRIILYCSILKRENFDWVTQKATEIGVSMIIPILSERTIKQNLNFERLKKIAKEASEQSGRCRLPEVSKPLTWNQALDNAKGNDVNFIFDLEATDGVKLKDDQQSVGVFIGPEGGWTPEEIKEAKKHDFKIASLGQTVLRAETAAIVASYLMATARS